jgi:hypothetical protein
MRKSTLSLPPIKSRDEAVALLQSGLAEYELGLVAGITAPIFWACEINSVYVTKNGSCFFANCGRGPLMVTAAHIYEQFKIDSEQHNIVASQVGNAAFPLQDRLIESIIDLDIAMFDLTPNELLKIKRSLFVGAQRHWPPEPPEVNSGILYAVFPGLERSVIPQFRLAEFRYLRGLGVATSVSSRDISFQIEREELVHVPGLEPTIPDNYQFGGISGGPMLAIKERNGIRGYELAGVIYEGPQDENQLGIEILRARRADFINADGTLDKARWHFT